MRYCDLEGSRTQKIWFSQFVLIVGTHTLCWRAQGADATALTLGRTRMFGVVMVVTEGVTAPAVTVSVSSCRKHAIFGW